MSSTDYSSDDSSDRSYGEEARDRFCTYQTGRFNGHECSRYVECPAHITRRAASDGSDEEEEYDEDQGQDQDQEVDEFDADGAEVDEQDPVRYQVADEASDNGDNSGASPAAHDVIDLTTPSPPRQNTAGHGDGQTQARSQPVEVINLIEDSPTSSPAPGSGLEVEASNGEPASAGGSDLSLSRGETALSSAQRRRTTPPLPPPPVRRRTSTINFGTVTRPNMTQAARPSVSRRPSELVLPRWQPDAEVTFCPICRTQFSFLIRKHHCRKCGRVVCARCSPHRITIPYQYIVQPPGTPRPGAQRYPASLISGEGGHADFSSLGGGEKVRLCNPCVPDPNTNPPDAQGSPPSVRGHGRSQSSVGSGGAYGSNAGPSQPGSPFDAYVRSRSATMLPSGSRQMPGGRYYQPTQSRILSGTPPSNYPNAHAGSPFGSYRTSRHHSGYEIGQSSSSSSAAARRRPLPPDPPQLAEEDECPICHRELPPRSLANFEDIREAHINTCITSHSTYGGPSSAEDSRPRRTGMFPYVATEKDCVDSAECTICLEEFEVGVPMARLECLCRFHRDCISRWFAKNPGRCPVHSHDGHGF